MTTSVPSGVGSSLGIAPEVTFGTFVPPTRWPEYESESVEWKPKRINGKGLYNGGLVARSSQRAQTTSTVDGDIKTQLYYKGMGLLLGNTFGSPGVAPVVQGATAAYLQTHALANNLGQTLSVQKGEPDTAGLIHQKNFAGCKVEQAVFECGVDEYLTGTFTLDGRGYDQTNAYVVPTFLAANPSFAFEQSTFKMGAFGSEVMVEGVRKFTLTLKRPIRKDRYYQDGSGGLKAEQVQNGLADVSLALETDYISDSAFVAMFEADTPQSIIITFTGPIIASTYAYSISFNLPCCRWDGEQPKVSGPDIIQPKMALVGMFDDTHPAITTTVISTDVVL